MQREYYRPRRRVPILLWPLALVWRVVTFIGETIGILMAILLGLVLMGVGWLLISSLLGAFIGIPLFILGLLLLIRGLY